jgi:PQQ-like domain
VRYGSPFASLFLLASVCVVVLASGCSSPKPTPARRTSVRPPPPRGPSVRLSDPRVTVVKRWDVKTGHPQVRLAQVKLGCVLVLGGQYVARGAPQQELLCLTPGSGKIRWRWRGPNAPLDVVATHSGVVTLVDAAGKHHFVDAGTGRKVDRPKGSLPGVRRKGPLVVDGHRYTVDGFMVRCAHAKTGEAIWESPTRGPVVGLRVTGRVVYYAVGTERAIHARDARSGLGLWLHQVKPLTGVKHPRSANFSFAVVNQWLYVARYDGSVGGFELRRKTPPPRRAAP